MLCTVAYIVSWHTDQEFEIIFSLLVATILNINTRYPPIVKYNPIFVKDRDKLPNIGASRLIRFLISNWSKGLSMFNSVILDILLYLLIFRRNKFYFSFPKDVGSLWLLGKGALSR